MVGVGEEKVTSTIRPQSSKDVYWQLLSDIVSSSPVGLEGAGCGESPACPGAQSSCRSH